MQETKKQEAIRLAYGEYWEQVKEYVDIDSGVLRIHISNINDYESLNLVYREHSRYRPLSLDGIETNNGWIRIESEADLPKNEGCYFVYSLVNWSPGYRIDIFTGRLSNAVNTETGTPIFTHYQPIVKPKPPIY